MSVEVSEGPKSTVRRDHLLDVENRMQKLWENARAYESEPNYDVEKNK
jgi:hypothetical protein